jgi:hypothetical protein
VTGVTAHPRVMMGMPSRPDRQHRELSVDHR